MKTQTHTLPFTPDPVQLYLKLSKELGRLNTMILESADVHTKAGQKSFLMIKAALKFRAFKERVIVDAISEFGFFILERLAKNASLPLESCCKEKVVFKIPTRPEEMELGAQLQSLSALDVLRDAIRHCCDDPESDPANFLICGILSYDLIDHFENLPPARSDPLEFPDYVFWFPESFVTIDHIRGRTRVVQHFENAPDDFIEKATLAISEETEGTSESVSQSQDIEIFEKATVDLSDKEYTDLVGTLKERVVAGDVFQIVPSRTFTMPCDDSLLAYTRLKAINPSPYMYYVVEESFELCGASPETFIKLHSATRHIEVKPIAGTRRRGFDRFGKIDFELDSRLEAELRLDTKELAEHMMLVDLARNDIARVSKLGTRQVDRLLSVERFSHVMHLVSQVKGELLAGLDGLHAYQASMNMGTLVGAPKIKAAEILRLHEITKRATYGGAIGYLDAAGNFDTAIIIRSAFIKNGIAHVRAGAGVVYDSVPLEETNETKIKASAVLKAIYSPPNQTASL